jgi:outer membrane murein-binding lipoprotein Lpp
VSARRALANGVLAASLALAGAACDTSTDDSGATTNLEDVGPDLARLRLEVQQLREEVRALQEQVLQLTGTTDTTQPLR